MAPVIERGSPEAIADCRLRLHSAKRIANREVFRQLRDDEGLTADDFEDVRDYDVNSEGDEQE